MRYPGPSLTRLEDDPGIEIVAKPDHTFDRAGDLVDNDAMLTMGNPVQGGIPCRKAPSVRGCARSLWRVSG